MSNAPTSIITRSEASYRLKLVSSAINSAVAACREGQWSICSVALAEALRLANAIQPHIEEAADVDQTLAASLKTEPAPPEPKGGMGYRGQDWKKTEPAKKSSAAPPAPIAVPKPIPVSKPIVTPPPRVAIITPPPQAIPRAVVEPTEPDEIVVFDLSRIDGQEEQIKAAWSGAPVLSEEEWRATKLFDRLPPKLQDAIASQYRASRRPVQITLTREIRKQMM